VRPKAAGRRLLYAILRRLAPNCMGPAEGRDCHAAAAMGELWQKLVELLA